jgi:hypothetical protein
VNVRGQHAARQLTFRASPCAPVRISFLATMALQMDAQQNMSKTLGIMRRIDDPHLTSVRHAGLSYASKCIKGALLVVSSSPEAVCTSYGLACFIASP